MDCLTFISKIIDSLVWPVTSIVLVLILKDEIRKVIPFLKKIKAGPVEAEFEREVLELKEDTKDEVELETQESSSKSFLVKLAEMHPRSAILESWVRVEAAARSALDSTQHQSKGYISAAKLAELLLKFSVINEGQVNLYHRLRRLRNDVAHNLELEPDLEPAKAYIDLSVFLQRWLEGANKNA